MREIRQTGDPERAAARPNWRRRTAVTTPVALGTLALALFAGGVFSDADAPAERPGARDVAEPAAGEATWAFVPDVDAVRADGGAELLRRAATAATEAAEAAGEGRTDVRDDQFVHVRSLVSYAAFSEHLDADGEGTTTDVVLRPPHEREVWLSVDGGEPGLLHEPDAHGEDLPLEPDPSTSYRTLEDLPTDAEAMLDWLYAQGQEGTDRDADQDAFVLVGDLLRESLLPPDVSAALYEAAARIPDVVLVPDAVNAADEHGVAVARVDSYNPQRREELIFAEDTLEYIGEREVAIESFAGVEEGTVLATTAVLERAVVDEAGTRP